MATRRVIAVVLNVVMVAGLVVAVNTAQAAPAAAAEHKTHAAGEAQALKLARKQNSEVMVDSLTTQSKTVAATPDGQFSATLTSGPTRVQQADDSWTDLNTDLIRRGKTWAPTVAGNAVSVGAKKKKKKVTVKRKGKKVRKKKVVSTLLASTSFPVASVPMYAAARTDPKVAAAATVGWPKGVTRTKADPRIRIMWPGKVKKPQVAGNVATYRNIEPGIDLQLEATSTGIVPRFAVTGPVTRKTVVSVPLDLDGLRLAGKKKKAGYRVSDSAGRVVAAGTTMAFTTDASSALSPGQTVSTVPVKVKKSALRFVVKPKRFKNVTADASVTSTPLVTGPTTTTNGFVWSADPTTSFMTQETNLVGKFNDANSVGRMFVAFDDSAIKGTVVSGATLSMYQRDGAACTQPRVFVATPAAPWNAGVTWANQPASTGKYYGFSDTQGHVAGQPTPCNPGFINPVILAGGVDISPLVKGWANSSITNNGLLVVSENESDPAGARVITSTRTSAYFEGLSIRVNYTPIPEAPTNPVVSPMMDGAVPTDQPTLSAVLPTDCGLENQTCAGRFQIVDADGAVVWKPFFDVTGTAGQRVETEVPSTADLQNNVPYTMKVFTVANGSNGAVSKTSADVAFTVDQLGPDNPTISSSGYQNGKWTNPAPAQPSFSFHSNGAAAFQVLVDGVSRPNVVASAGYATMPLAVPDGWHTLTVWAVDAAGNQSPDKEEFSFGSGGAGISAPTDQSRSAIAFPVAASAPVRSGDLARPVQASWQTQGDGDTWTDLEEGLISGGGEWDRNPAQRDPGLFTPGDLIWDTAKTPGVGNGPVLLNLRLCFTFLIDADNPECDTQKVQISRHAFGGNFATAPVGPGSVSLSTGEVQVPVSDAALPGSDVSAGRVWLSQVGGEAGVFGKGWQASTPAPAEGVATARVTNNTAQGVIILSQPSGAIDTYVKEGGGSGPGTYRGAGLTAQTSSNIDYTDGATQTMVLTDTAGTVTTFTSPDAGNTWQGTRVDVAGPHGVTTMAKVGDAYTAVTGVYTSAGAEADCADLSTEAAATTRGCRILTMNLAPDGTPSPTGDDLGDIAGQVTNMTVTQYDTDNDTPGSPVVIASYAYDSSGMLVQQWNPTQDTSKGPLLNQYEYTPGDTPEDQPQLVSLTPASAVTDGTAFFAPFTLTYDGAKLTGVNRRNPDNGQDSPTTISYGVSLNGDDTALPNLSSDRTPDWDQASVDAPTDATAVFYPDPNHDGWSIGDTPGDAGSPDWTYADITYLNEIGATTNSAVYGDGQWIIDTVVYDEQARVESTLSGANRAIALSGEECQSPVAVCARSASLQRARMLQTLTRYDDDLQVPIDTWGPAFDGVTSQTPAGTTETLKTHTHTDYNQGRPEGDEYANITLATTVKASAVRATATTDASPGQDIDTKVTTTGYSPEIGGADGWILRQPTIVTQKMPGADDISTTTRYNAEGNPTKVVSPGSTGSDSATTINEYYTGADSSDTASCANRPEWDGAICRSGPANAGDSGAPPVTTTTYSKWLAVASSTDKASNGSTKTVTNTYEPETTKLASVAISSTGGSDQPVPTREMTYDADTGGLATSSAAGDSVSSTFDHFGRQVSSTDATGVVTTTTYDIASRPVTVDDAKGVYTYTYDSDTERRGLVTREDTGIGGGRPGEITADYGTDGGPRTVTYPNGVSAQFEFNTVGEMSAKSYRDHNDDAMLSWRQTFNAFGQATTVTGTCSLGHRSQSFTYDNAARLTDSADSCSSVDTTRDYSFDVASNRTKLKEKQGTATTTWDNTFDSGSRQLTTTATGSSARTGTYSYDTFGRTTVLPGVDASPGIDTTLSYYADGSTYRQDQGDNAQTFTRDPLGRVNTTQIATGGGGSQNTVTNHYAGTGDSPTWTQDSSTGTWTRNVTSVGGALAILETGTGSTTTSAELQLASPHGDVVATIDVSADVESSEMSAVADYDEYGIIVTATAPTPYGWVGTSMRSSANQGGLIQMGARMYNPATGRFLTTDPVPGGTPNPYTYPPDPINEYDLDGTWSIGGIIQGAVNVVRRAVQWVANKAVTVFKTVVRAVSFGRININIPRIRIPKFKIRRIVVPKIKMSSSRAATISPDWESIGNRNWGKAASGVYSIQVGLSMVGGALAATPSALTLDAGDSAGRSVALGAAALYGSGLAFSGANDIGQGLFREGCPRNDCSWRSQGREFIHNSFLNVTRIPF